MRVLVNGKIEVLEMIDPKSKVNCATDIPPLGGYQAVAEILETTRQNIYNKWERMKQPSKTNHKRSDFPAPYTVTVDGTPLWNIDEIDEYARKNKLGKYKEPAE